MSIKDFFALLLKVVSDWHVIVTVVGMLFMMWFANFILTYRKRPPKPKAKKEAKAAPAEEAPAAEETEAAEE